MGSESSPIKMHRMRVSQVSCKPSIVVLVLIKKVPPMSFRVTTPSSSGLLDKIE